MSFFFRFSFFFPVLWILSNYLAFATNLSDENGSIANSTNSPPPPPPSPPATAARHDSNPFKPGIAVIVAILTTIFSITFLILLYVKHCRRPGGNIYSNNSRANDPLPMRKNSGINRKVIESLPIFRFSSLRGQKDGLECAVCLNKFEPDEVLRLLPKCKHAFHVECVDTWLDAHSTCPLCRYRVDPEDVLLIDFTSNQTTPRESGGQGRGDGMKEVVNPRVSGRHSSAGERGNPLEIIVETPATNGYRSRSSFDSWNSRRKTGNLNLSSKSLDSWKITTTNPRNGKRAENQGGTGKLLESSCKASRKDGQLPVLQNDRHRLDHRIIISSSDGGDEAGEGRRRWSDVEAADSLYLKTDLIMDGKGVINGRSVSEMTGVSRYVEYNNNNSNNNGGKKEERERQEEGVVKRWLAWISQSQQQQQQLQNTAVQSAASNSDAIVV